MTERYRKSKLAVTSVLAVTEFDFFGVLKFRPEEVLHLQRDAHGNFWQTLGLGFLP